MYDKHITYDRETRDYRMELDGRLIGYARTYHEAEVTLDQTVFELLTHGDIATATELDADIIDEPGVCSTCHGEGRIPAYGYGDQAGGYAETCPDCDGRPRHVSLDELPPFVPYVPLLVDVAQVLDMALGNAPIKDVVPELRRVRARLQAV